jgi:hypothetical protein
VRRKPTQWTIFKTINALLPSGNAFIKGYIMKQFAVELKRTAYVTIYVDAETKEQAEDAAWAELQAGESYYGEDADWECADVYEQFATDETRSYGA